MSPCCRCPRTAVRPKTLKSWHRRDDKRTLNLCGPLDLGTTTILSPWSVSRGCSKRFKDSETPGGGRSTTRNHRNAIHRQSACPFRRELPSPEAHLSARERRMSGSAQRTSGSVQEPFRVLLIENVLRRLYSCAERRRHEIRDLFLQRDRNQHELWDHITENATQTRTHKNVLELAKIIPLFPTTSQLPPCPSQARSERENEPKLDSS